MNKSLLSLTNKSAEELLSFLTENDIIDLDDVQNQMTKSLRRRYSNIITTKSGKVQITVIVLMSMTAQRNQDGG